MIRKAVCACEIAFSVFELGLNTLQRDLSLICMRRNLDITS